MTGKEQGKVTESINPNLRIEETADTVYLVSDVDWQTLLAGKGKGIDAARLGITKLTGFRFEHTDGTPYVLRTDYFGKERAAQSPAIGPLENIPSSNRLKVW